MEEDKKKGSETIIKCTNCGFKYYDGNVHVCGGVSVEEKPKEEEAVSFEEERELQNAEDSNHDEEKPTKEKKVSTKTRKDSFKLWKDH